MTSKKKALQLVIKFEDYSDSANERGFAKQCALIAVQEMIELLDELPINEDVIKQFAYLQEVKQEIKLL